MLYSLLFYLAMPFILLRLLWRSIRLSGYRQRLLERFGYCPFKLDQCLWVHAVSVGEALTAVPLIKALQLQYPQKAFLVTTMTLSGAERVQIAFGKTVHHVFIPYDLPGACHRFLKAMKPSVALIMETELWPNLFAACHQKKIPICLVNARLSEKSAKGYQRIASLGRQMLQQIELIAANGQADAERFIALGMPVERIKVCGNIKFDLQISKEINEKGLVLREALGKDRFIWTAGSTHDGEESIVLAAHQKLRKFVPDALLILVPRHPDRFNEIAKLCAQSFVTMRRSSGNKLDTTTSVYLGDTMGELLPLYSASDVAFVGGSLIPKGGHNMLEPAALKKPILSGPHLFNFTEVSALFLASQAMRLVRDEESLADALIQLATHPEEREQMGARAIQVMEANRGTLNRQLAFLETVLERSQV